MKSCRVRDAGSDHSLHVERGPARLGRGRVVPCAITSVPDSDLWDPLTSIEAQPITLSLHTRAELGSTKGPRGFKQSVAGLRILAVLTCAKDTTLPSWLKLAKFSAPKCAL